MKKKICIFIIMVVFTFVGLKTINASTLTKTDYLIIMLFNYLLMVKK